MTVNRDMFLQLNQPDAPISQIYFWNKTLHVSESSSVHHQEFFTVHTTTVYVTLKFHKRAKLLVYARVNL
jgi:hypothetical protein